MHLRGLDIYPQPVTVGLPLCLHCNFKMDTGERLTGVEFLKDGKTFYHYAKGYAAIKNNDEFSRRYKIMYNSNAFQIDVSSMNIFIILNWHQNKIQMRSFYTANYPITIQLFSTLLLNMHLGNIHVLFDSSNHVMQNT